MKLPQKDGVKKCFDFWKGNKMKLYYDHPAKNWHESLLLGNGRLGACVYGGIKKEIIALNEDTLWSGYPEKTQKKLPKEYIEKVRRLVKNREYDKATKYIEECYQTSEDVQMYLPFGNLCMEMISEENLEEDISEYHRELCLDTAEVFITYKNHGSKVEKRCLISQPSQLLVYQICSEKPFSIKISVEGGYPKQTRFEEGILKTKGQAPGRNSFTISESNSEKAVATFREEPQDQGMHYEGWGKAVTDGETEGIGGNLIIKNVKELTFYYDIRTSFAGFDMHPVLEGNSPEKLLEKDFLCTNKAYEELRKEHLGEYQKYYHRVTFSLGDLREENWNQDLYQRIINFKNDSHDNSLYALLFQYGRYLLIASSRPGTQAANLQGIWNQELIPPWFSNYTLNINTQMNYWQTGPCNLAEMGEPLLKLCEELMKDGKETAKAYFGSEGVCSFHNSDLWRKTTPADGKAQWNFWPMGFAWLCRNLYDQYLFTKDRKWLERIYPILKENVRFCLNLLIKTEKGYAISPATSPENEFFYENKKLTVAQYTENENAIVRNLFDDYLEASKILKIQDEFIHQIQSIRNQIAPTMIGRKGQILEWNEEFKETDQYHRHLSHLYELHPGRGITQETKEFYEAAQESLLQRGDAGTGWSLAWKILMWARINDEVHVQKLLKAMFHLVDPEEAMSTIGGGIYPNLLCAHPPYQIDGNFGYTAGVAEALIQSHGKTIHILPALPPEWTKGKVTGLKARGNITVDIEWDATKVEVKLHSDIDRKIMLQIRNEVAKEINIRGEK